MEVSGRKPLGSDDADTGFPCDPCKDEGLNAEWYCIPCNDFLCRACAKAHRTNKASKDHVLLDRDAMPKKKYTTSKENMCSVHTGKLVDYYCKTHGDFLCSDCPKLKEPKKCDLESIDAISAEYEKSNEYTSLFATLAKLTEELQTKKTNALKEKNDVDRINKRYVSDVKNIKSEMNRSLDTMEQTTLLKAQTFFDEDTNSTKSVVTTCDSMKTSLEGISSVLKKHEENKEQRLLVISAKCALDKIDTILKTIAGFKKLSPIKDYTFQPTKSIRKRIKLEESQLDNVN